MPIPIIKESCFQFLSSFYQSGSDNKRQTFRSVLNGLSVLLLSLTLKLPENGTGIGIKKGIETVIIFPIHNSSFHEQVEEIAIPNSWF